MWRLKWLTSYRNQKLGTAGHFCTSWLSDCIRVSDCIRLFGAACRLRSQPRYEGLLSVRPPVDSLQWLQRWNRLSRTQGTEITLCRLQEPLDSYMHLHANSWWLTGWPYQVVSCFRLGFIWGLQLCSRGVHGNTLDAQEVDRCGVVLGQPLDFCWTVDLCWSCQTDFAGLKSPLSSCEQRWPRRTRGACCRRVDALLWLETWHQRPCNFGVTVQSRNPKPKRPALIEALWVQVCTLLAFHRDLPDRCTQ